MKTLNILAIADTHGVLLNNESKNIFFRELNRNPDMIVCLGDVRKDELRLIEKQINEKYGKNNIPWIGIRGNHDDFNQFEEFDIIDIHDMMVIFNGIKIIGFEGSILYKEYMIGFTQEKSLEIARNMQQGADILICHSHPWLEEDIDKTKYNVHIGLKGTRYYLNSNPNCICIHGHDHKDLTYLVNNRQKCNCIYGLKYLSISI